MGILFHGLYHWFLSMPHPVLVVAGLRRSLYTGGGDSEGQKTVLEVLFERGPLNCPIKVIYPGA